MQKPNTTRFTSAYTAIDYIRDEARRRKVDSTLLQEELDRLVRLVVTSPSNAETVVQYEVDWGEVDAAIESKRPYDERTLKAVVKALAADVGQMKVEPPQAWAFRSGYAQAKSEILRSIDMIERMGLKP